MSSTRSLVAALATALVLWPATGIAQQPRPSRPAAKIVVPDLPFSKFVLPNGLTLIVREDHKAPIVAVNVWYHVGSKNERPGKTGFAHLFEHLMFNGSENYDKDYFFPFEQIGATDQNGTTNTDRTNYFQNVPSNAIDIALWMESDRMGHLLGAITQARLDEQRGVVQNEKRQGENQPYGSARELLARNLYPAGHPYSWTTIGSMEDLSAASLGDVKEWFTSYYGAANATIVIAGDITPEVAKQKVEKYFGDIPAGPPIARQESWIAKRTGTQRTRTQERVPQTRIYKVWNIPEWGNADADYLTLAGWVLSSGKSSRLQNRLVITDKSATNVYAYAALNELGGQFQIVANVAQGKDPAAVERAIDEEIARFLATGPTLKEVSRASIAMRSGFIQGIERIGGFGGQSDVLAESQVYGGSPDAYKVTQRRYAEATPAQILAAGKRWLSDGQYVLQIDPYPTYAVDSVNKADRSKLPDAGAAAAIKFPSFSRDSLSNGLQVLLAERPAVPQVQFELLVDAGFAADQFGQPGTANLALGMLDGGTARRSAIGISDELADIGSFIGASSTLDMSSVFLATLSENLDRSLDIYADVILHPAFPASEFSRERDQQLAAIQNEKAQPQQTALRVLPPLLYGKGHAYANPFTGSGSENSVKALTREDLVKFHSTWFKPNNATLVIVGATTMKEIKPKLERLFGAWAKGEVPKKNLAAVTPLSKSVVYLVDRPGAQQSNIYASNLVAPRDASTEAAIATMNTILGGDFTSRINMNLREDKHWSYGAFTSVQNARAQRPFLAGASVQTDKTAESMAELLKELRGIQSTAPVKADELTKAKASRTLTLPGTWETNNAVGYFLNELVTFRLDDRYYDSYADHIRGVTEAQIADAAKRVIQPDQMVWVVIGDRSKVEAKVRQLGIGDIRLIDGDGAPVASSD